MAFELCPACRELRSMRISVSARTEKTRKGKTKTIRTRAFHCEACHQFVRSEDSCPEVREYEKYKEHALRH
jgi:hypothetical protein